VQLYIFYWLLNTAGILPGNYGIIKPYHPTRPYATSIHIVRHSLSCKPQWQWNTLHHRHNADSLLPCKKYRGTDKALARPGRKQATATKLYLLQATQKKIQVVLPTRYPEQQWPPRRGEKWRPFNCFFSRVGLRTYQHPCLKRAKCKSFKQQIYIFPVQRIQNKKNRSIPSHQGHAHAINSSPKHCAARQ